MGTAKVIIAAAMEKGLHTTLVDIVIVDGRNLEQSGGIG